MFTGIITHRGEITAVREHAGGRELELASGLPLAEIADGASVAHSGICLTLTGRKGDRHRVQASAETLARTTLGSWQVGQAVNLERSLRLGDELGGHLVFGHVDGVGRITAIAPAGDYHRVEIAVPPGLAPLLAVKGSIAVDGISLTVNEAGPDRFAVTIIPHTWQHTTLGERRVGDAVNLEADMLARYVARQLACSAVP
ncbi:MAG: riboflavin synthase [Geminicoccaceae bacterium]